MVFSQTTPNTLSTLKVVEIDRLKPGLNLQANGSGVITGRKTGATLSSPVATTSCSEVFLKPEPLFESKMFHDPDSEFFQELGLSCFEPAKEELALTTDSIMKNNESAHNTDTLHTPFSPQGCWEFGPNSPVNSGFYNFTPKGPLSPIGLLPPESNFSFTEKEIQNGIQFQGDVYNINDLPVVLGDLGSEDAVDLDQCIITDPVDFRYTHTLDYTKTNTHMLLGEEDSFDQKLELVIPRDLHDNSNISDHIVNNDQNKEILMEPMKTEKRKSGLSLDLTSCVPHNDLISTPDVIFFVDQLENEKCSIPSPKTPGQWFLQEPSIASPDTSSIAIPTTSAEYEPITPKSESHIDSDVEENKCSSLKKRRRGSEDSDATYTPYDDYPPRKTRRRKPNVPIKDIILALEESQQFPKARRGRPPKRRESNASSIYSIDDNSSTTSRQELKYRELRDKNNEASKRSRMHRKLKELQMEQEAIDLEEKNKELRVKVDVLEGMTKKLKDALMKAMLQK